MIGAAAAGGWGGNPAGVLGDVSTTPRLVPGRSFGPAIGIAAGSAQSLFLRMEATGRGSIWGTGNHYASSLSPGSPSSSATPAPVARGDFVSLAAGPSILAALRRDTTLLVWPNAGGANGFALGNTAAANEDPDGDGLTTGAEWALGSDPWNPDTNGDGIPDGAEVAAGLSPTNMDMDGDGVLNAVEIAGGTDPFRADSDEDLSPDGVDCFPLDPTRWQCPVPTPGDTTPPIITLVEPAGATLISTEPPQ